MSALSILLVEDNPDHAELFELTLEETLYRGAELCVEATLAKCLERLAGGGIDLVFLDLSLPDSPLLTTIERLPEVARGHPVVVMTSLDHGPTMLQLISKGAEDCLPKSELQPSVLERVVRFALDRFEQRSLSQAVLEAAPDAMIYVSLDRKVLGCNQAFSELVGTGASDLRGRPAQDVCPAPFMEALRDASAAEALAEAHDARYEVQLEDAHGQTREGVLRTQRFVIGSGRTGGIVATFVDLTEPRRLERELREQEHRRFESLTLLAGGIAHEFNNSLMVILGQAELAKDDLDPHSMLYASMEDITKAAQTSAERVRQLLAFSGQVRGGRRVVELGPLVTAVLAEFDGTVRRGVEVHHIVRANPKAFGDPRHISLVLKGLVQNALEAIGSRGGHIEVQTDFRNVEGTSFGEIVVRDDGEGMDEATLKRALEPYFSTRMTGRGLGLAAANGVIQRYKGTLELESERGRGTTCRVLFPTAD